MGAGKTINALGALAGVLEVLQGLELFGGLGEVAVVGFNCFVQVDVLQAGKHFPQQREGLVGCGACRTSRRRPPALVPTITRTRNLLVKGQGLEAEGGIAVLRRKWVEASGLLLPGRLSKFGQRRPRGSKVIAKVPSNGNDDSLVEKRPKLGLLLVSTGPDFRTVGAHNQLLFRQARSASG